MLHSYRRAYLDGNSPHIFLIKAIPEKKYEYVKTLSVDTLNIV